MQFLIQEKVVWDQIKHNYRYIMNELSDQIIKFRETIIDILLSTNIETSIEFFRIFNEKINEQNCTKENIGPPRQR